MCVISPRVELPHIHSGLQFFLVLNRSKYAIFGAFPPSSQRSSWIRSWTIAASLRDVRDCISEVQRCAVESAVHYSAVQGTQTGEQCATFGPRPPRPAHIPSRGSIRAEKSSCRVIESPRCKHFHPERCEWLFTFRRRIAWELAKAGAGYRRRRRIP